VTRRDYILIAGAINKTAREVRIADAAKVLTSGDHLTGKTVLHMVVANLTHALAGDNPRFDRQRFMWAALEEEEE
jgi:hypothetical protein